MSDDNAQVTELSAEQLAELLGAEDEAPAPESRITVGIHVKKSAELPPAAYDIAEFVNILREQTETDFAIDIQAAVNARDEDAFPKTGAIGFVTAAAADDDGDDDDEEEDDE